MPGKEMVRCHIIKHCRCMQLNVKYFIRSKNAVQQVGITATRQFLAKFKTTDSWSETMDFISTIEADEPDIAMV